MIQIKIYQLSRIYINSFNFISPNIYRNFISLICIINVINFVVMKKFINEIYLELLIVLYYSNCYSLKLLE